MNDLNVGEMINYQGIGPGTVIEHKERKFQGQMTKFACIEFPHVEMKMQIPIGDEKINSKLRPLISKTKATTLIKELKTEGTYLARTWDRRNELALASLNSPDASSWAKLIRDFAYTEQQGVAMAISDINVIDKATKMLAAEVALATDTRYETRWREISSIYQTAASTPDLQD